MTRQAFAAFGVVVGAFAACGFAAERGTGRPHQAMAWGAIGVGLVASVAAGLADRFASRWGSDAVVVAYFLGVGVRGVLATVGASLLATLVFAPSERTACLLWVLAAYLAALVFETVRAVRAADRQQLTEPERGGRAE